MNNTCGKTRLPGAAAVLLAAVLGACTHIGTSRNELKLTGDQEVPPVNTQAVGSGRITVAADGSVSGSIAVAGLAVTMAHIHLGAVGKNGPVIIPLTKTGDGVWSVPPGARLTSEQLQSYQAGDLYVNVHTEANKGGEIRAQLKP